MSLINCSECNREISDKADTCPGCGAPTRTPFQGSTSNIPLHSSNPHAATPPEHGSLRIYKTASNEMCFQCSYSQAFERIAHALRKLGKIAEENKEKNLIKGRMWYGLQIVKLRISLIEHENNTTTATIQASSDDLRGFGAANATRRLIETVVNLDNPGYEPDPLGTSITVIMASVFGIAILVLLIISALG